MQMAQVFENANYYGDRLMYAHCTGRVANKVFVPLSFALAVNRFKARRPKFKHLRNQIALNRRRIRKIPQTQLEQS